MFNVLHGTCTAQQHHNSWLQGSKERLHKPQLLLHHPLTPWQPRSLLPTLHRCGLLQLVDHLAHDTGLLGLRHHGLEAIQVVHGGLGTLLSKLLAPCARRELARDIYDQESNRTIKPGSLENLPVAMYCVTTHNPTKAHERRSGTCTLKLTMTHQLRRTWPSGPSWRPGEGYRSSCPSGPCA
jgi:hypothetical protein